MDIIRFTLLTVDCPVCEGASIHICRQCSGTGGDKYVCSACRGTGTEPCEACEGTGSIQQEVDQDDDQ